MNRYFQLGLLFVLAVTLGSCQSYSKYTIDGKPLLKVDSRLLGIWKAVEDTNKADYFVVQTSDDLYRSIQRYFAAHPPGTDTTLSWKQAEDMLVNSFKELRDKNDFYYYITRMDNNGDNPHFQQWSSFLSRINGATFINIPYRNTPMVNGEYVEEKTEKGYFFVRILSITEGGNAMTIAAVKDPALRWLESPAEVRSRIASKMKWSVCCSDTLHLYKVSDYHFSLNDSKAIANPAWKK
jgi:hypothetical protein